MGLSLFTIKLSSSKLFKVYLKRYKYRIILLNLLSAVYAALIGLTIVYLKRLLDEGFLENNHEEIIITLLVILGIFVVQNIVDFTQTYIQTKTSNTIVVELKDRLYTIVLSKYRLINSKRQAGEILSQFYLDTSSFNRIFNIVSLTLIKQLFSLISIIIILVYLNWKFALICLLAYPIFILPLLKIGAQIRKLSQKYLQHYGKSSSILYESLYGYLIIKTYNLIDHFRSKYRKSNEEVAENQLRSNLVAKIVVPINDIASFIGLALILYFGISQVQSREITVGGLVAFLTALLKFYQPAKALFNAYNSIQTSRPGYQRINETLNAGYEEVDTRNSKLAEFSKSIIFENVSFSYDGETTILDDASFEIEKGEKVAITGKTGSGKSTIINLLLGLEKPTSGKILFDSLDYAEINPADLFGQFSYISQEPIMFNETIEYNIKIGKLGSSKEELIHASRKAQVHSFVEYFPDGYHTIVGDRGTSLSGGEKQRITIARALLRDAPLVIFDEATSSLDYETESEIREAIFRISENKTLIIITHRLSTLDNVDRILHIENGGILRIK